MSTGVNTFAATGHTLNLSILRLDRAGRRGRKPGDGDWECGHKVLRGRNRNFNIEDEKEVGDHRLYVRVDPNILIDIGAGVFVGTWTSASRFPTRHPQHDVLGTSWAWDY